MRNKLINFTQRYDRCHFAASFIWKNTDRAHRLSWDSSGLDDNATALALYTGSRIDAEAYDYFEPDDFVSFETLMQIMSLEGYGNYIGDDIKRDTQNFLAYCGSDCFFEQLQWFYAPNITNRILAVDDRAKRNIVIFKGLFLG